MTVGVVHRLEHIYICEDEGIRRIALLIETEDLVKRAFVEQIGQRVVLGFVADELMRFAVLLENGVVRFGERLQFRSSDHRHGLVLLYALVVAEERRDDQLPHDNAVNDEEDDKHCERELQKNIEKREQPLARGLLVFRALDEPVHTVPRCP